MPFFTTQDGCSLYYETDAFESSRPTVVFLNGTMQTTVYWKTLASMLKDRFRVLMYDARGQGQSGLGEHQLSLDIHVADIVALLQHVEVERAHLVGVSHGAKVALACAAHSPDSVDHIVLCSVGAELTARTKLIITSWLEVLQRSGLEAMARTALPIAFGEDFLARQARILPTIVEAIGARNSEEGLAAHLEAMTNYPSLADIAGAVQVPCLVVSGSDDTLVTEEGAEQLASLCNGRHERISGAGHSLPAEAPEKFADIVSKFLAEA
jgi:pimeloyl-ACP methyl ester carboxylesterase